MKEIFMKILISAKELEVLRKTVSGLSSMEIANQLKISAKDVESSLKGVMKNTQSKEPIQALHSLAKHGFQLRD